MGNVTAKGIKLENSVFVQTIITIIEVYTLILKEPFL